MAAPTRSDYFDDFVAERQETLTPELCDPAMLYPIAGLADGGQVLESTSGPAVWHCR